MDVGVLAANTYFKIGQFPICHVFKSQWGRGFRYPFPVPTCRVGTQIGIMMNNQFIILGELQIQLKAVAPKP